MAIYKSKPELYELFSRILYNQRAYTESLMAQTKIQAKICFIGFYILILNEYVKEKEKEKTAN